MVPKSRLDKEKVWGWGLGTDFGPGPAWVFFNRTQMATWGRWLGCTSWERGFGVLYVLSWREVSRIVNSGNLSGDSSCLPAGLGVKEDSPGDSTGCEWTADPPGCKGFSQAAWLSCLSSSWASLLPWGIKQRGLSWITTDGAGRKALRMYVTLAADSCGKPAAAEPLQAVGLPCLSSQAKGDCQPWDRRPKLENLALCAPGKERGPLAAAPGEWTDPGFSPGIELGKRSRVEKRLERKTGRGLRAQPKGDGKVWTCFISTETHHSQTHADVCTKSSASTFIDILST